MQSTTALTELSNQQFCLGYEQFIKELRNNIQIERF